MADIDIQLKGFRKTIKTFDRVARSMGKDNKYIENILLKGSGIIAAAARRNAPLGPTGNLKRGMVAKVFSRNPAFKPAAFAAVDFRIAPHAHLVEYGTVKTGAQPFFWRAVEASSGKVIRLIETETKKLIMRAATKK